MNTYILYYKSYKTPTAQHYGGLRQKKKKTFIVWFADSMSVNSLIIFQYIVLLSLLAITLEWDHIWTCNSAFPVSVVACSHCYYKMRYVLFERYAV